MHLHVYRANGQVEFSLEPNIDLAENQGLSSGEIKTAQS
ncbi:MAG: hypothetical protein M3R69_12560 [Acidobacteriota bacterium]|nr:hypothetical protein [Acidobacteriota bacterium]